MQRQRNRVRTTALALAGAAAAWAGAAADESAAPPPVALDRLLQLPASVEVGADTRGGATRAEWRARFGAAREELAAAKAALASSQQELEELAGDTNNWQMAPPGLGAVKAADTSETPLSYQLSQRLRRNREDVARSERRLVELEIQANLAGVPPEWLEPDE